jgi:mannose-6-phosphate isomerase-like protein (cupin superfamily)
VPDIGYSFGLDGPSARDFGTASTPIGVTHRLDRMCDGSMHGSQRPYPNTPSFLNQRLRFMLLDADNRPWGRWEEYLNEPGYRVKRIVVNPGSRLSLQKHEHRKEHWVVVRGTGIFTRNEEEIRVSEGDTCFIDVGDVHRIQNDGDDYLVFIETQMGLCIEDDIIRLEDDYGRAE